MCIVTEGAIWDLIRHFWIMLHMFKLLFRVDCSLSLETGQDVCSPFIPVVLFFPLADSYQLQEIGEPVHLAYAQVW
jgi:hypothetical protein